MISVAEMAPRGGSMRIWSGPGDEVGEPVDRCDPDELLVGVGQDAIAAFEAAVEQRVVEPRRGVGPELRLGHLTQRRRDVVEPGIALEHGQGVQHRRDGGIAVLEVEVPEQARERSTVVVLLPVQVVGTAAVVLESASVVAEEEELRVADMDGGDEVGKALVDRLRVDRHAVRVRVLFVERVAGDGVYERVSQLVRDEVGIVRAVGIASLADDDRRIAKPEVDAIAKGQDAVAPVVDDDARGLVEGVRANQGRHAVCRERIEHPLGVGEGRDLGEGIIEREHVQLRLGGEVAPRIGLGEPREGTAPVEPGPRAGDRLLAALDGEVRGQEGRGSVFEGGERKQARRIVDRWAARVGRAERCRRMLDAGEHRPGLGVDRPVGVVPRDLPHPPKRGPEPPPLQLRPRGRDGTDRAPSLRRIEHRRPLSHPRHPLWRLDDGDPRRHQRPCRRLDRDPVDGGAGRHDLEPRRRRGPRRLRDHRPSREPAAIRGRSGGPWHEPANQGANQFRPARGAHIPSSSRGRQSDQRRRRFFRRGFADRETLYSGWVRRGPTLLVLVITQLACNGAVETGSDFALTKETPEHCAPYGLASGRYEIRIEAAGGEGSPSYGLASVRIPEEGLSDHAGVAFELECEPPSVGPDAPFVIPRDPTSVILPLVITLPSSTPFSTTCELQTYAAAPTRSDDCVPWALGARVEARGLESLTIDVDPL